MSKTNIKCPRCHSEKLYKFGLDKQANQKYQCQKCKRQFAPDSVSNPIISKYPRCPKCNKATYLHYEYKHCNRYKCSNRKCDHIVIKHHTCNIDLASEDKITVSLSMKGIRFPLHIILTALTLYFLNNSSTRSISQFLMLTHNIKVSNVTITRLSLRYYQILSIYPFHLCLMII